LGEIVSDDFARGRDDGMIAAANEDGFDIARGSAPASA
jgi:hypothetical protein